MLGPLVVRGPSGVIDLGPPKQRALLALLLIDANRVVPVDRLVDDLWSGDPPPGALGAIHAYVSVLRRLFEPGRARRAVSTVIESVAPGYRLRSDWLDATRFTELVDEAVAVLDEDPAVAAATLTEALELWRGPVLAEFADEPWARRVAVRLDDRRAAAMEDRFGALLALGRTANLAADLESAVEEFPLRERLWSLLMLCQYRSGRVAEALRTYQRVRRLFSSELGIDPGPELQALDLKIAAHDASLDLPLPVAADRPDRLVPRSVSPSSDDG